MPVWVAEKRVFLIPAAVVVVIRRRQIRARMHYIIVFGPPIRSLLAGAVSLLFLHGLLCLLDFFLHVVELVLAVVIFSV